MFALLFAAALAGQAPVQKPDYYAPPPPAYYAPPAPVYYAPRSCWDPYGARYYAC